MMRRLCASVLVLLGLIAFTAAVSHMKNPYQYVLEADHHSLAGRISSKARVGDKIGAVEVEVHEDEGGHEEAVVHYLRVHWSLHPTANKNIHTTHTTPGTIYMTTAPPKSSGSTNQANGVHDTSGQPTSLRQTHIHSQTNTQAQTGTVPPSHTNQQQHSSTGVKTGSNTPMGVLPTASDTADTIQSDFVDSGSQEHLHEVPDVHVFSRAHMHNIHLIHTLHSIHGTVPPTDHIINRRSVRNNTQDYPVAMDTVVAKRRLRRSANRTKRRVAPVQSQDQDQVQNDEAPPHSAMAAAQTQLEVVVADTHAFMVAHNYIVVNDTTELEKHGYIEFYVYLANTDGEAISNPLPFIVYIDEPEISSDYPTVPAVFAGVLVLFVVFLAFTIPLVTRAKRRYRQGKPMFKPGSHPSTDDLEAEAKRSGLPRNTSEPNWYGNNAFYSYEEEVEHEKKDFSRVMRQYSTKSQPGDDRNGQRSGHSNGQSSSQNGGHPSGGYKGQGARLTVAMPNGNGRMVAKETLSEQSSSSGVDVSSQWGADGTRGEDSYSQRM